MNQHPIGLLQSFPHLEWKWEEKRIDFITIFPRTIEQCDSIMVVAFKLTKVDHFVPFKSTHKAFDITKYS
jgi:hypothetical protein